MISRLTVLTAIVNLGLSFFIIYSIINIQTEANSYVPKPIKVHKSFNDTLAEKINNTVIEKKNEENPKDSFDYSLNNVVIDSIQKYNLSEKEMHSLLNSSNPFGASSGKDISKLKEKIEQQIEETKKNQEGIQQQIETPNKLSDDNKVPNSKTMSKGKIQSIAELKAKKYDIPNSWNISVIEELSNYKQNLITEDGNTTRKGIMQVRDDKIPFILENLGIPYKSGLENDVETNIEMGSYYLSYLSKQNTNEHYPFTAFYLGPRGAETLFKDTGSYESKFSNSIIKKLKKT
ncbi:transglycosylase SLT domain-containing protein [Bacillus cereus]